VWTEDGDEVKTYCDTCQAYERAFARDPKKKAAEQAADMEFCCENCSKTQPIDAEELLRSQGLAICSSCGWVGYTEVVPKGQLEAKAKQQHPRPRGDKSKIHPEKAKRPTEKSRSSSKDLVSRMPSLIPQPSS
jgi:hypothetical protein